MPRLIPIVPIVAVVGSTILVDTRTVNTIGGNIISPRTMKNLSLITGMIPSIAFLYRSRQSVPVISQGLANRQGLPSCAFHPPGL